jgi:hypothetical protein
VICALILYVLVILKFNDVVLTCLYMPCKSTHDYLNVYCDTLAGITVALQDCSYKMMICGGDFNYDFRDNGAVSHILTDFMAENKLSTTHNLLPNACSYSYRHASLQAMSLIDHFLVSEVKMGNVASVNILDQGSNLSDHLPLVLHVAICEDVVLDSSISLARPCRDMQNLRWDKADLSNYYHLSFQYLSTVHVPTDLLVYDENVDVETARFKVNKFYVDLVQALSCAADLSVPKCTQNFFKFWWDEGCQVLKEASLVKHHEWVAAGRPREGQIAYDMRKARADYKHHLKQKRCDEHLCFTNELHEALVDKDAVSFWKTWKAKFGSKSTSQIVNGLNDHGLIAETFANVFAANCQPNSQIANDRLQQQFLDMYSGYVGDDCNVNCVINVELVGIAVRGLKRARAAGSDGITAEHLIFCHPVLCVMLSILFCLMLMYSYVPDAFGVGLVIPLLKGDDCDTTSAENYRAITLSPCISKVFEMCLSHLFEKWLDSDDLQFGFKKGRGCRDALFTLRGVIKHINNGGSTAVLCALDVTKAFDKMSHAGLYITLMKRNMPKCFLDVLICWYSKCFATVRWGNARSKQFQICAGVRQGGVLSPILFAVFIDPLVHKLRASGHGTCIGQYYFGCLLYADDILLVSHSIGAMQLMLDVCTQEACCMDFVFNTRKSVVLRVGPRYKHECAPLILSGAALNYVTQTKYLGAMIMSSRSVKFSYEHLRTKFYRSFNAMYYRARNAKNELVCVQLLRSVCLPTLLYCIEVMYFSKSDVAMLNHLVDRAVFRIFQCTQPADIQYIRNVTDLRCIGVTAFNRHCMFVMRFGASVKWANVIINANGVYNV